jgi:hypothetical protein
MSRNQRRKKRNKPGGGPSTNRTANRDNTQATAGGAVRPRSSTETKSAVRTTEFIAYAGAVLAVIITALAVDANGQGGDDPFGADAAIRYIAFLTIGYALARGLAKSGSHENRIEHDVDVDGAARDSVRPDEDDADDTEHDDDRVGDDDPVETPVVPTDGIERPAAEDVDARP